MENLDQLLEIFDRNNQTIPQDDEIIKLKINVKNKLWGMERIPRKYAKMCAFLFDNGKVKIFSQNNMEYLTFHVHGINKDLENVILGNWPTEQCDDNCIKVKTLSEAFAYLSEQAEKMMEVQG